MIIKRLIASWCITAYLLLKNTSGDFTDKSFAYNIGLVSALIAFVLTFSVITALDIIYKKLLQKRFGAFDLDSFVLLYGVILYAYKLMKQNTDVYLYCGVMTAVAIAFVYVMRTDRLNLRSITFGKKSAIFAVAVAGLFCFAYLSVETVLRYVTYSAPNFDFGIFVNMFYNMRKNLSMVTTCERDTLLSHYAVHVSPIYYLILPIYFVFPFPQTLQICQALIVASAVVPLYLLARKHGLSYKVSASISATLCFYPAILGGCSYDIHENCFLLPLILWLFYFFDCERYIPSYIFAILILLVKEDAFIYIFFFAIFVMVAKKKYAHGIILLLIAGVYFIGVSGLMAQFGEGIKTDRYGNFIEGDGSLVDVVINLFKNPILAISEIFEEEKLLYLAQLIIPLALLPFLPKKAENLLLLLPFILLNLMSDYQYQHSIFFQYNFGTSAFLYYAALLNLSDMSPQYRRSLSSLALAATFLLFTSQICSKYWYLEKYTKYNGNYSAITECISVIPENASVKSSTFILPHLAQRDEIYTLDADQYAEYAVVDLRSEKYEDAVIESYIDDGYELVSYSEGIVAVFRNTNANDNQ